MEHILKKQKENISILSIINWLAKEIDEVISENTDNKLLNQRAVRYILLALSVEDGITQNDIVRVTHLKGATISLAINKMIDGGLVVKKDDLYDKRAFRIYLTEEGLKLKKQVDSIMERINAKAMNGITKRDEDISSYVLFKMIENLTEK
jgi:DNA-binding MarR family transcriptional regulator